MIEYNDDTSGERREEHYQNDDTHDLFNLFLSFCPQHLRLSEAVNLATRLVVAKYHDCTEKTNKYCLKPIPK